MVDGNSLERPGAVIVTFPALVKAQPVGTDGRRLVEVEASVALPDAEGDLIRQEALLGSAKSFVENGFLDLDHYGELGAALGIANPLSWIVGKPLDVFDGGEGRTMVRGEISRHPNGHNPQQNKYDAFWDSLTCQPPVLWRASVYGYLDPATTVDCREDSGCSEGATRFIVNKFDWRSLAFTRNPVNQGIKSYAKVVSAKSWVAMAKAQGLCSLPDPLPKASHCTCTCEGCTRRAKAIGFDDKPSVPSMGILDREAGGGCPTCGGLRDHPTLPTWRGHLEKCLGWSPEQADLGAHAAMYRHLHKAAIVKLAGIGPHIRGPGNESLEDDPLDCPPVPSRSQG